MNFADVGSSSLGTVGEVVEEAMVVQEEAEVMVWLVAMTAM